MGLEKKFLFLVFQMKSDELLADETTLPIEKLSDVPVAKEGAVTGLHLLGFAKNILLIVSVLFLLAAITELWIPGNKVYEACKITLPSIATLVIGYYFGSSKSQ